MTTPSHDELRALGLLDARLDEPIEISIRPPVKGHGLANAATEAGFSAASMLARLDAADGLRRLSQPRLAAIGLELRAAPDAPHLLMLRTADARPLRLLGAATERAVVPVPSLDGAFFVDAKAAGLVAMAAPEGQGLALRHEGGTLRLWPLVTGARPLELPARAVPAPPVATWAERLGDESLRDEVTARADVSPWTRLVAAGLVARHAGPPKGTPAADWRALLGGGLETPARAARRWAAALDAEAVDTMRVHVLAAVDDLEASLDALDRAADTARPAWRSAMLDVLHAREELECVAALVRETAAAPSIDGALRSLDARGRQFVSALPGWRPFDDALLRRGAAADPESWWAALALEGNP